MKVLAAPTAFKGTYSAIDAARLMALAVDADPSPVADGGDSTLDVLHAAIGGRLIYRPVHGPFGDPVRAAMLLSGRVAVIEMAAASGLRLVARRDPIRARTWGVGELMLAAGDREIWLGVGGSATVDGGLGALAVLGDRPLGHVTVLCDVRTKFLDAPRVFGPQKGASPRDVVQLTGWFRRWAAMIGVRSIEGSGAAGGLAGGLAARGAKLVRGSDFILRRLRFERRLRGVDLVITGEGRFDATSLQGKATGAVIAAARRAGVRVAVVCGRCDLRRVPPGVIIVESGHPGRGAIKALRLARR